MSQYISVGITDEDLIFKGGDGGSSNGGDPVSMVSDLLDFIAKAGLSVENAVTSPEVQDFMSKANIKVADVKAEEARRKQKSNLLLWGGVAAGVAFLALRKSK